MKRFFIPMSILMVGLISPTDNIYAQGWFYQNTFSTNVESDSNRRLRRNDEEGVVGINAQAGLQISRQTEISEMYLRGSLRSVRFDRDDDVAADSDDQLLYAGGRWDGERSQFSIDGEFLRQSSQLTELTDSGFLEDVSRRVTKTITPQVVVILSEETQLSAGINYREVDFPNSVPVSLTEFSVKGANIGVTHNLNELNSISTNVFYSEFEADTFLSEVETTGINIRYNKVINELWTAFAGIGYRKSNFTNSVLGTTVRGDDTGESYEFGVTKQTQTSSLQITVSNELQPSASGDVNERIDFSLSYNQRFSPRWTGLVDFEWFENKSINDDDEDDDREFWQLVIGSDYQITPGWYLTGRIRHREQKFSELDDDSTADSDAVILGVRYSGKNKRFK